MPGSRHLRDRSTLALPECHVIVAGNFRQFAFFCIPTTCLEQDHGQDYRPSSPLRRYRQVARLFAWALEKVAVLFASRAFFLVF
jgi:hypothetical protein